MRLLGRLKIVSGWTYVATHVAGVDHLLADGVSRWNRDEIGDHLAKYTNDLSWKELDLGRYRNEMCWIVSSESEWNDDTKARLCDR